MQQKIILYGGGGHAKTLIDLIRGDDRFDLIGIVDDVQPVGATVLGIPVIGIGDDLVRIRATGVSLAVNAIGGIGNPDIRWRIFQRIEAAGFAQPSLVHPRAFVEETVRIDDAVQVLAGTYISSDSSVAYGTVLNAGVILSHDNHLGRCVNLSPGATLGGNVSIGDFTQVGMRATINAGVTVGSHVRIGNGATVKSDVPNGVRVYAGTIWPERKRTLPDASSYRKIA